MNFIFMTEMCDLSSKQNKVNKINFLLEKESQIIQLCTKTWKRAKYFLKESYLTIRIHLL